MVPPDAPSTKLRLRTWLGALVLNVLGLLARFLGRIVFGSTSAWPEGSAVASGGTDAPPGSQLPDYTEWRGGTSRRAKRLSWAFRILLKPVATWWPFGAADVRARGVFDRMTERFVGDASEVEVVPCEGPGFTGEWVRAPESAEAPRVVLFLHGGGFIFGRPATHRALTARLASAARCQVLAVGYRIEKQRRHASAVDDCLSAYQWLLEQGWQSHQVVICGDSAGGNFAVSTALRARDLGLPRPAGLVTLSAFLDLSVSGESIRTNARSDAFMPVRFVRNCANLAAQGHDPSDPALNPIFADLAGLPPTLVQVSSSEVLLSDSVRLAAGLTEAGVPCLLQVWEKQVHVFQLYGALPEAAEATREIAHFVDRVTSSPE